jgi:hypothetical protein
VDDTPPVIILLGDNPLDLTVGDPYVEPNATASDDVDGDITNNIVINASGEIYHLVAVTTRTDDGVCGIGTSNTSEVWRLKVDPSILPVELLSFTGRTVDKQNILEWTSASEEAFSHYELERSSDGAANWLVLGEVAGAGQVGQAQAYTYNDDAPLISAYYRLRMVDLDGSFAYSNIVYLEKGTAIGELVVYPNPNNGQFIVEVPTDESAVLTLHDLNGRNIWQHKALSTSAAPAQAGRSLDVSVGTLPEGVYLLSAKTAANFWTKRIIVR